MLIATKRGLWLSGGTNPGPCTLVVMTLDCVCGTVGLRVVDQHWLARGRAIVFNSCFNLLHAGTQWECVVYNLILLKAIS